MGGPQDCRDVGCESAATLIRALVASHIDYCNAVLTGASKVMTDKLQQVLNAAAGVATGTNKFDCGFHYCYMSYKMRIDYFCAVEVGGQSIH